MNEMEKAQKRLGKIRIEKRKLWDLRNDVKAHIRKLQNLRYEIATLVADECRRRNLPNNMEPKDFLALLRKYRGLNRFCAYTGQRRDPIHHGELYEFCRKIHDNWTINDVNELIRLMQHYLKLTKEQAIAKIIVDMAYEYVLLYEYFMEIPNYFVNFVDEKGRPASVCQANVLRTGPLELLDDIESFKREGNES